MDASDLLRTNHFPIDPSGLLSLASSTYVSGDETSVATVSVSDPLVTPGRSRNEVDV